jgi:peptide deformylase
VSQPFVLYPDERLAEQASQAPVDAALLEVGRRLKAAAVDASAYGLAAAHIGEVSPVVIINTAPGQAQRADLLLFNPRVVAVAPVEEAGSEGSVSLPGIQVQIERPVWAEIAFDDETGAAQTRRFESFVARCALHEIEQMNGRFFLSRLSRLKREAALKKYRKLSRAG